MKTRRDSPASQIASYEDDLPDQTHEQSWLSRLAGTLNLMVVMIFLAAWITGFLLLDQTLTGSNLPGNLSTDLACLSYFGGLIIAFIIAAVASNILRRILWKYPFLRR